MKLKPNNITDGQKLELGEAVTKLNSLATTFSCGCISG